MKKCGQKLEHPIKLFVYILALIVTFIYIGYRIAFTLPFNLYPIDIIFGLIVIVVELIETIEFVVYFWNILRLKKISPATPKVDKAEFPDVDVLIATYNEDLELIKKTAQACQKMKYPDSKKVHIFICDDGKRTEIKKLAKSLKVGYITRQNNAFAKAGNYNNAIKETDSPYVAVFDADMCPTADFLLKTVPFFLAEDKVGFVQTPQSFRNQDIFQARLGKNMPFEQDYFYHYIQLARNNSNSVILCGTNCVISREALKKAGGFARATIAEDVATGMLIEAKGYRGIAISDVLAHGEAINNLSSFLKQRSRWGRGCIQTAKAYGIFRQPGLTLRQKFDYFVAINYWCFGLRRMLYLALPLLFAFFGIIAIQGDLVIFAIIFFSHYLLKRFAIDLLEGRRGSSTWTKIFELIQAPFMALVVLKEVIGFSKLKFEVTPKGTATTKTKADWILYATHLTLLTLNIVGIIYVWFKMSFFGFELFAIPFVWMIINSIYLFVAVIFDLRSSRQYKKFKANEYAKYGIKSYLGIMGRSK